MTEDPMVLPKHVTAEKDRHGNLRLYFRAGHGKRIRLRVLPGHDDFDAAYRAACNGHKWVAGMDEKPAAWTPGPGTLSALVVDYCRSDVFKALDPTTQNKRRAILEGCLAEKVAPSRDEVMGDCPIKLFHQEHVKTLAARKAGKPEAANGRVKAIRVMFKWAGAMPNPAVGVSIKKSVTGGHHTWTIEEVEQFWATHPIGSKARKAMDIFLFGGLRISDACRFGRQHVRGEMASLSQWKGRNLKRKMLEFPILPVLRRSLDACPSRGMTFLETEYGKPYSVKGLGNAIRTWCDAAGLPHCSAHGLRKAAATFAAENGATEQQLMSIFGWDDPRVAAEYVRTANRRKMATMGMHFLIPNPSPESAPKTGEG